MQRDLIDLDGLTNEQLLAAYNAAYEQYIIYTKKASLEELHSVRRYGRAKDEMRRIKLALKKRGVTTSTPYYPKKIR